MQTTLPVILTFLSGMLMVVLFFIPRPPFTEIEGWAARWAIIVSGFALLLGIDSLVLSHMRKVQKGGTQAIYSLALIVSFFITLFWGIYAWWKYGNPFSPTSSFLWLFRYVYLPLDATMFALLAFFIASAAYRAFRARNLEATLLLLAASIVMMGRVPLGGMVYLPFFMAFMLITGTYFLYEGTKYHGLQSFLRFVLGFAFISLVVPLLFPQYASFFAKLIPNLSDWIMNYPNIAGQRGIQIGLVLGSIAFSLRIIFGIERGYLR